MNDNDNLKNIILTARQVSEYLHIPLRTIHHLSKRRRIKAVKIGRHWRYLKSDVDKFFMPGPSSNTHHVERRAFSRINSFIQCNASVVIPQKKEVYVNGRIVNIGEGGIFIKTDNFASIKNDDPINVRFELDGKRLDLNGRVLRAYEKGIGVKFGRINLDQKELISEYVR